MKIYFRFLILTFFILIPFFSICQRRHEIKIGLNAFYFNDWNRLTINIFNPELSYSSRLSDKYGFTYSLNFLYGENFAKEMKEGDIIYRLLVSNDITFDYLINNFSFSAGPSIRYRKERKILYFYPQPNPFEFVIDGKSHFDFGAALKSGYNINLTKKSIVVLKLSYRLYNKGVNPVSFGVSYGLAWD